MASKTTNYGLNKHSPQDLYNVEARNENWDKIDEALAAADPTKITAKAAPADGDGVMIADSADGGKAKRLLWSSVKTALGKLFVPLARTVNGKTLAKDVTLTGENITVSPTDPTSISSALKYRCNPNLLDNWYFANPANQRNGYIVPAGVEYFKVDGFVPQGPIPETVRVDYIDYAGSAIFNYGGVACYVPKDGGYVRGYTAVGYTVDRWMIGAGSNGTLSLTESGLKLTRTDGVMYLTHRIPKTQISEGNTLTYSALTTLGLYSISFIVKNDTYHEQDVGGGISLGWNYTPAEIMELTLVNNTVNSDVTVLAAKLELGGTQTLAHKENGVWVLNEIPDFGEQLRRCQRYFFKPQEKYGCYSMVATGSNSLCGNVIYPVEMRIAPSISLTSIRRHDNATEFHPTSFIVGNNGGRNGFSVLYNISDFNVDVGAWCGIDFTASADL